MNFTTWMHDRMSDNIPTEVIAFNFNLYESMYEDEYDVELVGCTAYDRNDPDWASDTQYSSGDEMFSFSFPSDDQEGALEAFIDIVKEHLANASANDLLKNAAYVTAGFVDGDLEVIKEG